MLDIFNVNESTDFTYQVDCGGHIFRCKKHIIADNPNLTPKDKNRALLVLQSQVCLEFQKQFYDYCFSLNYVESIPDDIDHILCSLEYAEELGNNLPVNMVCDSILVIGEDRPNVLIGYNKSDILYDCRRHNFWRDGNTFWLDVEYDINFKKIYVKDNSAVAVC